MEQELEDFVRELRDKREIYETMMLYCRGIDRGIPEMAAASFWPDATIDTGILVKSGSDTTTGREWMDKNGCKATMHFLGNQYVELQGDIAFCETYMLSYMTMDHEGAEYTRVRGSRYIDRWERREGSWKVARRVVVDDWTRFDPSTALAGSKFTGRHHGKLGYEDEVFRMKEEYAALEA
jgi:hypothetical protein